jgi:hypothetical protein
MDALPDWHEKALRCSIGDRWERKNYDQVMSLTLTNGNTVKTAPPLSFAPAFDRPIAARSRAR